jgi:hypothetical protein
MYQTDRKLDTNVLYAVILHINPDILIKSMSRFMCLIVAIDNDNKNQLSAKARAASNIFI